MIELTNRATNKFQIIIKSGCYGGRSSYIFSEYQVIYILLLGKVAVSWLNIYSVQNVIRID